MRVLQELTAAMGGYFLGSLLFVIAFAYANQARHLNKLAYNAVNLLGAVLLLISLYVHFNLAAFALEVAWAWQRTPPLFEWEPDARQAARAEAETWLVVPASEAEATSTASTPASTTARTAGRPTPSSGRAGAFGLARSFSARRTFASVFGPLVPWDTAGSMLTLKDWNAKRDVWELFDLGKDFNWRR